MKRRPHRTPPKNIPVPSPRWILLAGPAFLAVASIVLIAWSWGKWPDAMVDFGRELYVPWQLAAGKKLYADIAYFNGPLSPYLNAFLFRCFGASLRNLVLANIAVLAFIGTMIHRLLLDLGGRLAATVGVLVFLAVFSCAQYMEQGNYNFITPYSHEMTHGTALSLAALVLLLLHLRRGGTWCLFGCGAAVGLTFLTKAEFFVAVTPPVVTGLVLNARLRGVTIRKFLPKAIVFLEGLLLPPLAAFLLLLAILPVGLAFHGLLGSWNYLFLKGLTGAKFYRDVLGTGNLPESLELMGNWTLRALAFLVPAAVIASLLRPRRFSSALLAFCLGPMAAGAALIGWRTADWGDVARPFPLGLIAGAVVLSVFLARPEATGDRRSRLLVGLCFVLYSLLLLLKIFFNVRFFHYGFALAMPATLVLVLGLLTGIPWLLDRWGGTGQVFRSASLGLLAALIFVHLYATQSWFERRTVTVGSGSDAFLTDGRGRLLHRILERLDRLRAPGQTLVVLPEGVILNYLLRTTNPTPYINFMPPEILMFGEDRIVGALRARPPDWIVLTDRTAPEYGYQLLGDDYGVKILDWVEENYALEEKVEERPAGDPPLSYGLILRRKDEAVPSGAARPLSPPSSMIIF